MSDEYINLKEYFEWLEQLKADGKIIDYKTEKLPDGNIEVCIKPVKPVDFIKLDFKNDQRRLEK